jgi:hypothetical protein
MTACILLAWLKLLALDGDLARAEGSTLPPPARRRLPRPRRTPQTPQDRRNWPWTGEIVTAWQRVHTIPHLI